ncbi:MAG: TetR/AcrR family transcriptional regulator [Calditrichota bacterium]
MTEHQSSDARRDQILDAAGRLFIKQGFENSTVDQIATEAGLSKGAIYWYFKSKLEILFELTDRCLVDSQQELARLSAMDQMGPEALFKSHRILNDYKSTNPEHDQIFCQLLGLANRYPEIRDHIVRHHHKWDLFIAELIQNAIDKGIFRPVNAKTIGQAINALYDGLYTRVHMDPDLDVLEVIETTTRLMYDALITPEYRNNTLESHS